LDLQIQEASMFKKFSFFHSIAHKHTRLIVLVCVVALGASACGGLPSNSMTPTPTTLMGVLPPVEQSTGVSTEIPTSGNADSGKVVDICSLITKSDAEAVLGQTVTSITPGVDSNNSFGGTLNFCTFLGQGLAVVVSRVDLGSANAAGQAMKQALVKMQSDATSTTTPQLSGPGDQAYWSTSEHAAEFTVLKGNTVFSVLLGGNIGDPAAHKAGLLDLTKSVAAKL
jgi:hypothetical protein